MKILLLSRYEPQGASSRMRFYQFLPMLQAAGIECVVSPLLTDSMVSEKYQFGRYAPHKLLKRYLTRIADLLQRHNFDLVWIEKEALPWMPAWLETCLLHNLPYVLDFDDAIFHNYDLNNRPWVRAIFGRRIDRLMCKARLVIAGNDYLAERAIAAKAPWVEVLPTVVDINRYAPKSYIAQTNATLTVPRIVWIGSPSTARYLELVADPLRKIAQKQPFILRIIGIDQLLMPGVEIEILPWSSTTETTYIAECDIGIMPLIDAEWERGKCGYKLIQYMACALPVIASPVGANIQIVRNGENGFLADTSQAWESALQQLLESPSLRASMGQAGRYRAEKRYCIQEVAPRLIHLLKQAKTGQHGRAHFNLCP